MQQRAIDTRRSPLTKGALYFHFPSKEAIIAEQGEWLSQHHTEDSPPIQTVVDLSYAFIGALIADPLTRASIRMTFDRAADQGSIARGYGVWIAAVETLLTRARVAGTLNPGVRLGECAYTITSAMTGLQRTSDALTGRKDLVHRVEAATLHGADVEDIGDAGA